MNLIELLVVFLLGALLMLLGRVLFGAHGWLLGAIPFGLIVLLLAFAPILVKLRKFIALILYRRKKADDL
jgi:hypothetical protein